MRKILLLVGVGWLVVAGAVSGFAQSAQEMLDALPAKIRSAAETKAGEKSSSGGRMPNLDYLLNFASQSRQFLADGQEDSAIQQLRTLAMNNVPDSVRDNCEAIINKLRADATARETAADAAAAVVLQHARDAVVNAKAPKDLDATLAELSRAAEAPRDPAHPSDRFHDPLTRRFQSVIRFVNAWQDYLVSVSRNDGRRGAETLRTLLQSDSSDAIQALGLPRSEIVTRIPSASQSSDGTPKRSAAEIATALNTVLEHTKTLDDLPAAIKDLQAIRDEQAGGYNSSSANDLNSALSALQTLHKTRLEFQAGLHTNLMLWSDRYDISSRIAGGIESHLVPLRAQLVALELPRLLGASPTVTPAPGETLDVFWRRLVDDAKKRGDWAAVAQGLDIGRTLVFTADLQGQGSSSYGLDTTGFKNLLAAFNFEKAQQFTQAAAAYLSALNSTVPDLPVTLIGERLAAIKKDHPKDYEEAAHTGMAASEYWSERLRAQYLRTPDPSQAAATPSAIASPLPTPTATPTPTASPSPTP